MAFFGDVEPHPMWEEMRDDDALKDGTLVEITLREGAELFKKGVPHIYLGPIQGSGSGVPADTRHVGYISRANLQKFRLMPGWGPNGDHSIDAHGLQFSYDAIEWYRKL